MVERDAARESRTDPPRSGDRRTTGDSNPAGSPGDGADSGMRAANGAGLPAFTSLALVAVHEIGNVLGWLEMTVEIVERTEASRMRGETPTTDMAALLRDARLGVRHVSAIVTELRSFGRPDAGVDRAFDPVAALRAAIRFAESRIASRAQLRLCIDPTPPVRGSPHELTCVFLNLLLNATEAIAEGGRDANVITVRAGLTDGGEVLFQVEDTGRGIAAEVGHHIFDPYFTGRAERGGTGLGLHVSRRIVRAMGGEISFESAPGLGSLFRVVLPPAASEAD